MHRLLIIEDPFAGKPLASILGGLQKSSKIVVANDIVHAALLLQSNTIDLMIVDLSSGYGTHPDNLTELSRSYPYIPVLAVTEEGQKLEEKMVLSQGVACCLQRPLSSTQMEEKVLALLKVSIMGWLRGFPLPGFLQMMENDEITCSLIVNSGDKRGMIYFQEGTLVSAETNSGLSNEQALYAILVWEEILIQVRYYNGSRHKEIEKPLLALLIEAYRHKDEGGTETALEQITPSLLKKNSMRLFNDIMTLSLGTKIRMECDKTQNRVVCTVAGILPNHSILVTPPRSWIRFKEMVGNILDVTYIHMGRLCTFKTTIVAQIEDPTPLLYLKYPGSIRFEDMRRTPRASILVPTKLKNDREYEVEGVFTDISSSGCRFEAQCKNGVMPSLEIDGDVQLSSKIPGLQEKQWIRGRIKNIHKSSGELELGIHFETLPEVLRHFIEEYVQSQTLRSLKFPSES
ncbi:MAG: DUF4388 domain-containing protein [Desulfopila sp.]|nr:DUF4388 domain-containing protein [Desulfopila sp.]